MSESGRIRDELAFHDEQALARREFYRQFPERLPLDEETYLNHESWIRPGIDSLGELRGLRVLDYGCGHGMAAALFAKRGADVTAFDLSPFYLDEARQRGDASGVGKCIQFLQASAEHLPFRDASFDRIWGSAILHHLDLRTACRELARVLKQQGRAVFCEPWGGNPILEWARRTVPYPSKFRTVDEQPLRLRDLRVCRRHFHSVRVKPFQLLSMARRVWPGAAIIPTLDRWDAKLLKRFPGLGRFCRYILLSLQRPRGL